MNFNYFDIHSHLNFPQFDEDREEVIQKMQDEGIGTICVGTGLKTSEESIELAKQHKQIWATIGVHPTDWKESYDKKTFSNFLRGKASEKVVGIGETGLDYYRDQDHKKEQKELFEAHIELATESGLPLMLHGRPSAGTMDAYEDMLEILKSHEGIQGGHIHFFVGDMDRAREFIDLGFTIGFDGPITFSRDYDDVVRFVPLDRLCAETDAPFAAPEPYRGRRNSPAYVPCVVEALARIRQEDVETVRKATVENALRVFGIEA